MSISSTFPRAKCATPSCDERRLPGSHFGVKCIGPVRGGSGKSLDEITTAMREKRLKLQQWLDDEPVRRQAWRNAHRVGA